MMNRISIGDVDSAALQGLHIAAEELKDDFSDYSKVVVRKPWGYEYLIFQNDKVAAWILYLKQDAQTSMHCHPTKRTALVVLEGEARCCTLREERLLAAGDGLLLEKGVFHQTTAVSSKGAVVLEIETPNNKRDLVRLQDRYGRAGQGYESADHFSVNTQNYNYLSFTGEQQTNRQQRKRFGHCTLTLKQIRQGDTWGEIQELDDHDLLCLLNGEWAAHTGEQIVEIGDTISAGAAKRRLPPTVDRPLELLIIKKIDRLIKISDYIVTFLKAQNVHEVFFVPGDANVHLLDSVGRDEKLQFICTQMEKNASMAAEAYAKLLSDLAVLLVSSGASGPNALAGVANAWVDSVPMLVISGQARSEENSSAVRQLGNKSLNIVETVRPLTKYAVQVTDPMLVKYHLEKGVHLATTGRPGPVWLDIPIDVQGMIVDADALSSYDSAADTVVVCAEREALQRQVAEVAQCLRSAKRPVFLAGHGIRQAKAEGLLQELIGRLGIPVLASRRGADLLHEDHPLFFGRPGGYGQRGANFIIQNCDLLLNVGSRCSIPLIGRNTKAFARDAKKVVVDIDANELQKSTIHPDIAIHADAKQFMTAFLHYLGDHPVERAQWTAWLAQCATWAERFPPLAEPYPKTDFVQPYYFVRTLSEQLDADEVIVVDGGPAMNYAMQAFQFKQGQRLISSTGLELPGFAVPAALGVGIGRGRRRVICLCEDRGFLMGIQELETISRYRIPVKFFVLKSKGHSNIRQIQKDYFGGRYIGTDHDILFESPSVLALGKIYGFAGVELKEGREMAARITHVLQMEGAVLCEIHVDAHQDFLPRLGFTIKDDGKWIAKPLEDMHPYLERDMLKQNMLIDLLPED